jgi:hypothetical protein
MPDPISSRVDDPYRSYSSSNDEDLTCKQSSSESSTDPAAAAATASDADAQGANSSARGVAGPTIAAHIGQGEFYAGVYALKGSDPSGIDLEIFSASAHGSPREAAFQAGLARVGSSTDDRHWSARAEVLTAHICDGFDNADGSVGFHGSVGATVIGVELTGTAGPLSLTAGISAGPTFGYSFGTRDSDHDGLVETCERLDFGVGTLGYCLEERR